MLFKPLQTTEKQFLTTLWWVLLAYSEGVVLVSHKLSELILH